MTKRNWELAWEKVKFERQCRVCKEPPGKAPELMLDPAHVIPRSMGGSPGNVVLAEEVIPLCRTCHDRYDTHSLDLLPYLSKAEQARAVLNVGLMKALRYITGQRWRSVP